MELFNTNLFLPDRRRQNSFKKRLNQIVSQIIAGDDRNLSFDLPPPAIVKPVELWTGKQVNPIPKF
jgi:hypothetical protein